MFMISVDFMFCIISFTESWKKNCQRTLCTSSILYLYTCLVCKSVSFALYIFIKWTNFRFIQIKSSFGRQNKKSNSICLKRGKHCRKRRRCWIVLHRVSFHNTGNVFWTAINRQTTLWCYIQSLLKSSKLHHIEIRSL